MISDQEKYWKTRQKCIEASWNSWKVIVYVGDSTYTIIFYSYVTRKIYIAYNRKEVYIWKNV